MRCSIIIPTADRPQLLENTLDSIVENCFPLGPFEVIVVNNGDGELAFGDGAGPKGIEIKVVRERSKGLHFARHAGARHASSEILAYTDDDVECSGSWLEALISPFTDPDVACVGGPVEAKWQAPVPEWMAEVDLANCGWLSLLDLGEGIFELPEGSLLHGCNMAVRRAALFEAGGFHPDGFPSNQLHLRGDGETGLLRKLRMLDKRILYSSSARIHHVIPPSRMTLDYALERMNRQGISRAFTVSRDSGGSPAGLLMDAAASAVMAFRFALWRQISAGINHQLFTRYYSARLRHDWRLLVDPELRKYTVKSNYLQ
jgi:glucosyl-dolichyl phosphate glucuronosyltransferase